MLLTWGRADGSSRAQSLGNGSPHWQVRSYGSMVDVCFLLCNYSLTVEILVYTAGSGKSVLWFVIHKLLLSKGINVAVQLRNYR
jgi:hypothetical protein